VLSLAMALENSLGVPALGKSIEQAVDAVLASGLRTRDLGEGKPIGTREMGCAIADRLKIVHV
jgi:isocitrate/isopropylmalate dehydrogenase